MPQLAAVPEAPPVTAVLSESSLDFVHAHRCSDPSCAAVWRHSRNEALAIGLDKAHACPRCGKEQRAWYRDSDGVAL